MSKRERYYWTDYSRKLFQTAVEKFNKQVDKLKKLEKAGKLKNRVVPDKIKKTEIRDISYPESKAYREYMRESLKVKNQQQIKNEYGVTASLTDLKKIEQANKIINARRKKIRDQYVGTLIRSGSKQAVTGATRLLSDTRMEEMRDRTFNFDKIRRQETLQSYLANSIKMMSPTYLHEKNILFKKNYMKAVQRKLGAWASIINPIINRMNPEKFVDLYYRYEDFSIDFIYDLFSQTVIANTILDILEKEKLYKKPKPTKK